MHRMLYKLFCDFTVNVSMNDRSNHFFLRGKIFCVMFHTQLMIRLHCPTPRPIPRLIPMKYVQNQWKFVSTSVNTPLDYSLNLPMNQMNPMTKPDCFIEAVIGLLFTIILQIIMFAQINIFVDIIS